VSFFKEMSAQVITIVSLGYRWLLDLDSRICRIYTISLEVRRAISYNLLPDSYSVFYGTGIIYLIG
jgi:hypothetical protein